MALTTQNATNIVDAPISDPASKTPSCLNDWSNKDNQILHRRPSISSTVCPVRMQATMLHGAITWRYFMVLLLHGATVESLLYDHPQNHIGVVV